MTTTRWVLIGILVLATTTRLYQFNSPLIDQMFIKQVFVANKARAIAGPPFNPLCNSFDFLDEDGNRSQLHEEIPLYTGLLGGAFYLFGEHDWIGRIGSIFATLVALVAFFDLTRREFSERLALVATLLLATNPLLIFYGRAILPDPAMLACMLLSACFYRRYLDGEGVRWLVAATTAGLLAGAFKYYGLMVLLPLADMSWRKHGWRGWFRWDYALPAIAMVLPVAVWVGGVFQSGPNPTQSGDYFLFQKPEMIAQGTLYKRFFERFLYKDCGPLMTALVVAGVWAVWTGRVAGRPLLSWTVMGVFFYFLFGPKLDRHDYYELMMLPAAAVWGGIGWVALWEREAGAFAAWRYRAVAATATLALVVVVQSPLIMRAKFRQENGQMFLAGRLRELTPAGSPVLLIGPEWMQPVVHYCGHEGWALYEPQLDPVWQDRLAHYRALGAKHAVVYFSPWNTATERDSYSEMIQALPVVEHHTDSFARKGTSEFYILNLQSPQPAAAPPPPASR